MNGEEKKFEFEYYKYIVCFHSSAVRWDYNPVVSIKYGQKIYQDIKTTHLLENDLNGILPAIGFTLQLPRGAIDLYNLPEDVIDKAFDYSHDIHIIPDFIALRMMDTDVGKALNATVIFYADDCRQELKSIANRMESIPVFSVSRLNEKTLNDIYQILIKKESKKGNIDLDLLKYEKRFLLREDKVKIASVFFLASQYEKMLDLYKSTFQNSDMEALLHNMIYKTQLHNEVLCVLLQMDSADAFKCDAGRNNEAYAKEEQRIAPSLLYNVVITVPGVPKSQIKLGNLSNVLPENERHALRLMGLHRAIADNAILVELPTLSKEYFVCLDQLERACKSGTNNPFVWRKLSELGKFFEKMLTKEQKFILSRAKHISVFSNAPIGLGILPGTRVPFHNIKEISYHSITPMGRTFPMEMLRRPCIYFKYRFKLLFAECIPNTDENRGVLSCSKSLVHLLKGYTEQYENFEFRYRETLSINALKAFIEENKDASAIIISAHGNYQMDSNTSCIMVGKEHWMANDISWIPPLVLLSACHTAPRGSGCVSVADLFLRLNAIAVLTVNVPLNAYRNSILFARVILYILEAQKGSKQYRNMLDLWTGVTSGNAIHEIMQASKELQNWLYEKNSKGILRLQDFELNRANKRGIRSAFVYQDTINILNEMLEEEGLGGKYDAILKHDNYFPESSFYFFLGAPENIIIYNEVFERVVDKP